MITPTNYSITFVGAGRLATQLAIALQQANHEIKAIYSKTLRSAEELQHRLQDCKNIEVTDSLKEIPVTDVYIVAVADNALPEVLASWPEQAKGGVVLHTAGSQDIELLHTASEHYGVLYPMQTFSKDKLVDFRDVYIYIESNDVTSGKIAYDLASSISNNVNRLSSADRKHLHLGAVVACNFSNHLYELAFSYLSEHGINPECLLSLIDETSSKLREISPHEGQTGPARRHDESVIQEHLSMLENHAELRAFYEMFTESIIRKFS